MSPNNPAQIAVPTRDFHQELEYLYRRLSTVNNLIRLLEEYNRFRPQPARLPRQKTA